MKAEKVDYDDLATGYHRRYKANPLPGVEEALVELAGDRRIARALEAGCGTGRWLAPLAPLVPRLYGLDSSLGMLRQAAVRAPTARLLQGDARHLPLPNEAVDLVICVNALHHFISPEVFLGEARRVLRPGGRLALVGLNPHRDDARWSVYDYFPGTRETDLERYPTVADLEGWLAGLGFEAVRSRLVEHLQETLEGRAILDSPFLQQGGTSQLALLSAEAYQAGMERIVVDLEAASAAGKILNFVVNLHLHLTIGAVPG